MVGLRDRYTWKTALWTKEGETGGAQVAVAPLGLPDDQALTRSLHDSFAHLSQRVDFKNSFHLFEEPV